MRRSRGRQVVVTVLFSMVATLFLYSAGAAPAAAADSDEDDFLALVNQERAGRGLGRLVSAGDLVTVARRHSARMSEADDVFHNSNLPSEVDGWELLGENVGVGPTVKEIHNALMASRIHRDVILHPRFTQLGVGLIVEGGEIWLTQVFRLPDEQAAPVTTTAPPAPAMARPATTTTTADNVQPALPRVQVAGRGSATPVAAKTISPPPTASTIVTTETTQVTAPVRVPLPAEPVIIESAGTEAVSMPFPQPAGIPAAGVAAAGLLLLVVGSAASVSARRA